mmetsp:Transcript_13815/g.41760  ORF Transcript_13815/g.41760 Transcript_13815/m.41760 type:complete len:251 (-) Transcript_13815:557-1309(-)
MTALRFALPVLTAAAIGVVSVWRTAVHPVRKLIRVCLVELPECRGFIDDDVLIEQPLVGQTGDHSLHLAQHLQVRVRNLQHELRVAYMHGRPCASSIHDVLDSLPRVRADYIHVRLLQSGSDGSHVRHVQREIAVLAIVTRLIRDHPCSACPCVPAMHLARQLPVLLDEGLAFQQLGLLGLVLQGRIRKAHNTFPRRLSGPLLPILSSALALCLICSLLLGGNSGLGIFCRCCSSPVPKHARCQLGNRGR